MSEDAPFDADVRDMARLAGGDHAALDDLMDRHASRLLNYLTRLLRDESEAEDAAQETFVRVFQKRDRYDSTRKFSTWLYTIATNLARDRLRRTTRHPKVSLDGQDDSGANPLGSRLAAPEAGPDDRLLEGERAEAVRKAVSALPEDLRAALILFEYEDLSHAEIAAVLDCTPKAVETRIYRARGLLRSALKKFLEIS